MKPQSLALRYPRLRASVAGARATPPSIRHGSPQLILSDQRRPPPTRAPHMTPASPEVVDRRDHSQPQSLRGRALSASLTVNDIEKKPGLVP